MNFKTLILIGITGLFIFIYYNCNFNNCKNWCQLKPQNQYDPDAGIEDAGEPVKVPLPYEPWWPAPKPHK